MPRTYFYYYDEETKEHDVGVSTEPRFSDAYLQVGYAKVDRDRAIRELRRKPDENNTVIASINGDTYKEDPAKLARELKNGTWHVAYDGDE